MAEALPTTRRVELIKNRDFAKAVLDKDVKLFVVYESPKLLP